MTPEPLPPPGCEAQRLIQLSDPHLGPEVEYRLAGMRTYDSLSRVLAQLRPQLRRGDQLVVSGDIAGHGATEAYRLFERQISSLNTPYYWLPGNHDDLETMHQQLQTPFQFEVRIGNWLLLMLNSNQPGKVGGLVPEPELLKACTAALKHDGPVAVFVHHPPTSVGSAWIDTQQIDNADDLLARLSACGNVRAIFTGHVHQEFHTRSHGIEIYTTPSTCFQFAANSIEFAIGSEGPGYRWIDLHPNGDLDTGVVRLAADSTRLDRHCIGY